MGLKYRECLLAITLLAAFAGSGCAQLPQVTIPQGDLLGIPLTTNHNRSISGFLGIPYAQPPLGDLRFSAPVAADGWNTIRNASVAGNHCSQYLFGMVLGDEDCLYLNVYTPQLPENADSTLLPVMVHLHFGAFQMGTGSPILHGPGFLLDKDVVLVVINYRLGALGFFSTGDEAASGNWGLKDAVLALKWVRDNVAYFGGDPTRVTLFGQSAGAAGTQMLALSDSTIGLFQKYIIESGSALMPLFQTRDSSAALAVQLGEQLGCSTTSSTSLVTCLRGMDSTVIINESELLNGSQWLPTDEGDVEGAVLVDTPENLYVAGQARDVPLMAGVTRDEMARAKLQYSEDMDSFQELMDDIDGTILSLLIANQIGDSPALTEPVKARYFPNMTADISTLLENFKTLIEDIRYRYPIWKGLQKQLSFAQSSQYFYTFEYRGTYSYVGGSTTNYGVAHCDDLLYLFPQTETLYSEILTTPSDLAMVDTMVELWTSFATNGIPVTSAWNGTWEPYSSSKFRLRIGNESDPGLGVEYNFYDERIQFWHDLTNRLSTSAAQSIP